jgi:hypothetical protein
VQAQTASSAEWFWHQLCIKTMEGNGVGLIPLTPDMGMALEGGVPCIYSVSKTGKTIMGDSNTLLSVLQLQLHHLR